MQEIFYASERLQHLNCFRNLWLGKSSSVSIKNVMLCELLKDYPMKAQDIKRDILSPFSKIFNKSVPAQILHPAPAQNTPDTGLSLVQSGHVTKILASHWLRTLWITCGAFELKLHQGKVYPELSRLRFEYRKQIVNDCQFCCVGSRHQSQSRI